MRTFVIVLLIGSTVYASPSIVQLLAEHDEVYSGFRGDYSVEWSETNYDSRIDNVHFSNHRKIAKGVFMRQEDLLPNGSARKIWSYDGKTLKALSPDKNRVAIWKDTDNDRPNNEFELFLGVLVSKTRTGEDKWLNVVTSDNPYNFIVSEGTLLGRDCWIAEGKSFLGKGYAMSKTLSFDKERKTFLKYLVSYTDPNSTVYRHYGWTVTSVQEVDGKFLPKTVAKMSKKADGVIIMKNYVYDRISKAPDISTSYFYLQIPEGTKVVNRE